MYRFVILSFVAVVASAADIETCKRSLNPGIMRCCKKDPAEKFMMMSGDGECFKLSRDPASCPRDVCMAKKKGLLTADDKIDKTKLEESITKDFEGEPELVEAVVKNCVNGDISMYGPPDFCDLMKMRHCLTVQTINVCPEWNDENDCKGTKELVEECKKIFS